MTAQNPDKQTTSNNCISIELLDPNFIVLPISADLISANGLAQFLISIVNHTSIPCPFISKNLNLKIFSSSNEAIEPENLVEANVSDEGTILIPPSGVSSLLQRLTIEFLPKDNFLELKVEVWDCYPHSKNPNSSYFFKYLRWENYRFLLSYVVEENESSAASLPVDLRINSPINEHNMSVNVDGIYFSTLVPKEFSILSESINTDTSLEIALQIINTASKAYYFSSYRDNLILDLVGESGFISRSQLTGQGSLGLDWLGPVQSNFHLVLPGNIISLPVKAFFEWQPNELLALKVSGGPGDNYIQNRYWVFNDISPGKYWIRLIYRSSILPLEHPLAPQDFLHEDMWVGMVHTPFVAVQIVRQ